MNQKLVTRILALLLVLAMVLGMIPLVFADEGNLGSGTPDGTPPVLLGMELSMTTVSAPNTIEVTIEATDDVSGVKSGSVYFWCEETKKDLWCSLSATYYKNGQYIPYEDGKLHGTIKIDQYLESGTFVLTSIGLSDAAGNHSDYNHRWEPSWNEYPSESGGYMGPIPEAVTQREIHVVSSDAPDGTPPVLITMELSSTAITAPGTIEVTIEGTDDVSGLKSANVSFWCEETKKDLYCSLSATYYKNGQRVPYEDGKLHGTIQIDQFLESGTFVLTSIGLSDAAGNHSDYNHRWEPSWNEYPSESGGYMGPIPEAITQREIHVTDSGTPDGTPPVLVGMDLATTTITAPGTIEIIIEATDDVSGLKSADVGFWCEETKKDLYCSLSATYYKNGKRVPYEDGKLHGTIKIDQYLESGTFVLSHIGLSDNARNHSDYNPHWDPSWNDYPSETGGYMGPIPESVTQREINVLNAVPDVATSVAKPEFVDQIKDSADDAYIVADFSGEATLPETAFDAISGTDKTLDLVSEGVTWRFNGNDITGDSKPIDLNVNITKLEESPSAEIQEKLDDTPAVVMKFAENGVLPGKATIQVKVDYAMREYLGASRELCVYYFNNQTGKLELIAENLMVINDTYIEFPITHCSYYILSTKIEEPAEPEHEYQYGDANHDGKINVTDAVMVMKHRANALTEEDVFCERCANVDTNSKINVSDAVLIMKKRANKDMIFPIEAQ